jgi:hypothetical protein
MYRIALIIIAVCLAACSGLPETAAPAGAGPVKQMTLSLEYLDENGSRVSAEFQPKNVLLEFPYIPGQVFGGATDEPVFIVPASVGSTVTVKLVAEEAGLNEVASPLRPGADTRGLTVTPENARFARMGTFPYDARTYASIGGGGFLDPVTRDALILMYFDRACVLSGVIALDSGEARHSIDIPGAGFHWIRAVKLDNNDFVLSRAESRENVIFSITLYELQSI